MTGFSPASLKTLEQGEVMQKYPWDLHIKDFGAAGALRCWVEGAQQQPRALRARNCSTSWGQADSPRGPARSRRRAPHTSHGCSWHHCS